MVNFEKLTVKWNEIVNEWAAMIPNQPIATRIYYKLPSQLEHHHKLWVQSRGTHATLINTASARSAITRILTDPTHVSHVLPAMTFAPETVNMSVPAAKGKEKAVAPLKVAIPLFKIALSASPMSDIHMSDTISTPTQPTAGPPHLTVPKKGLRGIVYPARKINAVKLQIVQGEGAVVFANVLIIQFLKAFVPKHNYFQNTY